ncbi:MAG: methyltransferase [Paraglaciecola sp.]|uniref:tRNA1(Val) (adenine(37)-N6)-methyltransferase n=1 Tax=Paraglaciecola sp. TaxID=1920173 RepID=UPI00329930ED
MGFKFKQFTIEDYACAMKVGTDSLMLGSWVQSHDAQKILDIGTGSGLLAIMLAQKSQQACIIDAIDIDAAAISQARDNAKNCPWEAQLSFHNIDLQTFCSATAYDLIVSNPPYFPINIRVNKTQSAKNRLNARQTLALDHPTLLRAVSTLLSSDGKFCCVLPMDIATLFITEAESVGLFCTRELQVQPKPSSPVIRLLLEFTPTKTSKNSERLTIYNHLNQYTQEYKKLCKDYYLNF